jgi:hypothetical protein
MPRKNFPELDQWIDAQTAYTPDKRYIVTTTRVFCIDRFSGAITQNTVYNFSYLRIKQEIDLKEGKLDWKPAKYHRLFASKPRLFVAIPDINISSYFALYHFSPYETDQQQAHIQIKLQKDQVVATAQKIYDSLIGKPPQDDTTNTQIQRKQDLKKAINHFRTNY